MSALRDLFGNCGLDMYLTNASDWNISTLISFQDVPAPVLGPVAGSGLAGVFLAIGMIGLVGWRRRRKAQAQAATIDYFEDRGTAAACVIA